MSRYSIEIEYDGSNYCGWQRQSSKQEIKSSPSIQSAIEEAIFSYCGENVSLTAAGRTDAGVHAINQVAHFDLAKLPRRGTDEITAALNAKLQEAKHKIAILATQERDDDFSARFNAKKRQYLYKIIFRRSPLVLDSQRAWHITHPLDIEAMQKAAQFLCGRHDFSSFRSSQCQAKSPVRSIDSFEFFMPDSEQKDQYESQLHIIVTAKSFLHNQVRAMIGTLYNIGRGAWQAEIIPDILAAKSRSQAGPNAPAHGLYLYRIFY